VREGRSIDASRAMTRRAIEFESPFVKIAMRSAGTNLSFA
jgi:hypothetical protein